MFPRRSFWTHFVQFSLTPAIITARNLGNPGYTPEVLGGEDVIAPSRLRVGGVVLLRSCDVSVGSRQHGGLRPLRLPRRRCAGEQDSAQWPIVGNDERQRRR